MAKCNNNSNNTKNILDQSPKHIKTVQRVSVKPNPSKYDEFDDMDRKICSKITKHHKREQKTTHP